MDKKKLSKKKRVRAKPLASPRKRATNRPEPSSAQSKPSEDPIRLNEELVRVMASGDAAEAVASERDISTNKSPEVMESPTSPAIAMVLSPDGQTLVCGYVNGTIKLWDISSGSELGILSGHTDRINCLIMSPDGQFLFSGSSDKTIKLWNLSSGYELHTFSGHEHAVLSLAISSDGQTLTSSDLDGTIKLWDLSSGNELRTLDRPNFTSPAFKALEQEDLIPMPLTPEQWDEVARLRQSLGDNDV